MKKILVIGQTPPPIGGQAVMINLLVQAEFTQVKIIHIRMQFSREMNELGRIQVRKIFHLLNVLFKTYIKWIYERPEVIYFPPSGPTNAVYRDMAILIMVRFLFKKTVFHFHASGLSEKYFKLGLIRKWLFRIAFFRPDLCIHLSESCPQEGIFLKSKKNIIIPYGVMDLATNFHPFTVKQKSEFRILFMGLLDSTKGELDVMRSVQVLKKKGIQVLLKVAGQFKSKEYEKEFFKIRLDLSLESNVEYAGILQGMEKINAYQWANVFCFPSYFNSESFPLVLIEAMQFGLPIIASRWRGIPDMVQDQFNGFLVDVHNPVMIAKRLEILTKDPGLCDKLGKNGRRRYEMEYTLEKHLHRIESAFLEV